MLGSFLEVTANADIAQLVNDAGQLVTCIVDGAKEVMSVCTEYPANVFIGLAIMGTVVGFASRFIRR